MSLTNKIYRFKFFSYLNITYLLERKENTEYKEKYIVFPEEWELNKENII